MAQPPVTLRLEWQWNRPIAHTLAARVTGVAAESTGFLGIRRSPSLADAMPDARILTATVLAADAIAPGAIVTLRLPGHELPPLPPDAIVAIGYTADNAAIRIAVVPPGTAEAGLADWLRAWRP